MANKGLRQSMTIRTLTPVVTAQDAAIQLYRSRGFCIYGTEREAFSNQGNFYDEHLMELLLQAEKK